MVSYFLYRIVQNVALSLPLKTAYSLAVFISTLYATFAFRDRKAVTKNLRVIFPEKPLGEIRKIRKELFHNFAKYLIDFFRFDKLDKEYIEKNIRLIDLHYYDECLSEGKGAIVVTAHLGNWELGGVVIAMLGYPFLTVALPHKSKNVNALFNGRRESKGVKVLPLGNAAKGCLRALRNNELIALVGDRDFGGNGMVLDFFGRPTIFPIGPAVFSLKTKAKIVPGFMLRNKDDSFSLIINKPIDFTPSGDEQKDLKEIITSYKIIFEDYIRRYPEQWYMFRRFWKE
ncbi:MAG: lysophospholipid acyltransferase family protein [Candidatus Omnitrophota bacterium]|jgi:KDO2-lipid IV(A) lauroyltransferase|nr:lysophospholipid acyltransferase family protein [Candidatus Omnitrophota bacterium]